MVDFICLGGMKYEMYCKHCGTAYVSYHTIVPMGSSFCDSCWKRMEQERELRKRRIERVDKCEECGIVDFLVRDTSRKSLCLRCRAGLRGVMTNVGYKEVKE